mgnify:FL=1
MHETVIRDQHDPSEELTAFVNSVYLYNDEHYDQYALECSAADSTAHATKLTSTTSFASPDPVVPGLSDRYHGHQRQIDKNARVRGVPSETRSELLRKAKLIVESLQDSTKDKSSLVQTLIRECHELIRRHAPMVRDNVKKYFRASTANLNVELEGLINITLASDPDFQ